MDPRSFSDLYDDNGYLLENALPLFPQNHVPERMKETPTDNRIHFAFCLPRPEQTTIAPGRDFYITGALSYAYDIPDNALFTLQLIDSNNNVVRHVSCNRKDDKEHLYIRRPTWIMPTYRNREVLDIDYRRALNSCVPDLVFDASDELDGDQVPPSLFNTWNKAYYTDTFFSALIYGGTFADDLNYYQDGDLKVNPYDENGKRIEPLKEGEYIISISITDEGYLLGKTSKIITIGHLKNKVLGAFTDNESRLVLFEHDGPNDGESWTVLWDAFPGSWVRSMTAFCDYPLRKNEDERYKDYSFLTNVRRMNYGDACEYRGGDIHLVNYALRDYSNSTRVELAEVFLQKMKGNRNIRLISHYYDGGQPFAKGLTIINPVDPNEQEYGRKSNLLNPAPGELVIFTSIDISHNPNYTPLVENDGHNLTDADGLERHLYSEYLFDGTTLQLHKESVLRLNGVCMLPEDQTPSIRDNGGGFMDLNTLCSIRYKILANGEFEIDSFEKPIGLVEKDTKAMGRWHKGATRVLEFKHNFEMSKYLASGYKRFTILPVEAKSKQGVSYDIVNPGFRVVLICSSEE